MKKFVLFAVLFFVCGCSTYTGSVKEVDPLEVMGMKGKALEGKIFVAECKSGSAGNKEGTRLCAIEKAAEKSNMLGYNYFTIINSDSYEKNHTESYLVNHNISSDTNFSMHGTNGNNYHGSVNKNTSVPVMHYYNYQTQYFKMLFLVLKDNELEKWDNIYSVDKYLVKEESN